MLSQSLVSAVLIIFQDLHMSFTDEEMQRMLVIEKTLLTKEITNLPIYFVQENAEINALYDEYQQVNDPQSQSGSFYDLVMKHVFFDSHQFVVTGPQATAVDNAIISSLQVGN